MTISPRKTFFWITVITFSVIAVNALTTHSQSSPVFWVTWNAESFTAAPFLGKPLPSRGTKVNVSFELFQNGKTVSLNSQPIKWFLNGALVQSGEEFKNFSFVSEISSGANLLRIEIPGFRGSAALAKTIQIPTASPETVIDIPYDRSAIKNREITVRALPYYFNVMRLDDLSFDWKVNGQTPKGLAVTPDFITITVPENIPPGSKIFTEVEVVNLKNSRESANSKALFTTQ